MAHTPGSLLDPSTSQAQQKDAVPEKQAPDSRTALHQLREHLLHAAGPQQATYNTLITSYLSGRLSRSALDEQVTPLIGAHNLEAHTRFLWGFIQLVQARRQLQTATRASAAAPLQPPPKVANIATERQQQDANDARAAQADNEPKAALTVPAATTGVKRPLEVNSSAAATVATVPGAGQPKSEAAGGGKRQQHSVVARAPLHPAAWRDDFPVAAMAQLRAAAQAAALVHVDAAAAEMAVQAVKQHMQEVVRHTAAALGMLRPASTDASGDDDHQGEAGSGATQPADGGVRHAKLPAPVRLRLDERIAAIAGANAASLLRLPSGRLEETLPGAK